MNLQKYLLSALGGAVMIIVSLLGLWGKDVSNRANDHDNRIAILEQSRAQHDQELADIHQDLLRIERLLEKKNGK